MKSCFGSRGVLAMFLAVISCGGAMTKGGAAGDAGPSCPALTRPASCPDTNTWCILDLRAARSRFPTCRTGYGYLPFVVSCGMYDGVVHAGIDSATTYYFDHSDGHLVGVTNTGVTTLAPCGAFDPSFTPTVCDSPADCPADAGPDA